MGINANGRKFFPILLNALGKEDWKGISMLEYGNQIMKGLPQKNLSAKEYFSSLGVKHVSIDWNGKDGALRFDLRKPIKDIGEPFDIVTNFGTTEHVIGNQYQPFKTIHEMVKVGGLMFSFVPGIGFMEGHGHYRYDLSFFENLSEKNNYKIIFLDKINPEDITRNITVFIGKKTTNENFISEPIFETIIGLEKA